MVELTPQHHDACAKRIEPSYECTCGLDLMERLVDRALTFWAGVQYADSPNPDDRDVLFGTCKHYSQRNRVRLVEG